VRPTFSWLRKTAVSIRYMIGLVPEAAFTARIYQARQIICGQYANWASEMFPVNMPLSAFILCPEEAVASLDAGLHRLARGARGFALRPFQPAVGSASGHIFLDFDDPQNAKQAMPIRNLHSKVSQLLKEVYGVAVGSQGGDHEFKPRIFLMQQATLSEDAFLSAVVFAKGVVSELMSHPGESPMLWRAGGQLIMMRLESQAADVAPDGWIRGDWARDLRFNLVASHQL